jgi:hypothetical protein
MFAPSQVSDFSNTGKGAQTIAQIARLTTDIDIFLNNRYSRWCVRVYYGQHVHVAKSMFS